MMDTKWWVVVFVVVFCGAFICVNVLFFSGGVPEHGDSIEVQSVVYDVPDESSQSMLYGFYSGLPRERVIDYGVYVFSPFDDVFLEGFVDGLVPEGVVDEVEVVNLVASFVQDISYELDTGCEYPQYPVETIVLGRGDCEDKAILCASLLDVLGFNVSLIDLPAHMAVGVHFDNVSLEGVDFFVEGFLYLEVTLENYSLGEVPKKFVGLENVTVYPISDRMVLYQVWDDVKYFLYGDVASFVTLDVVVKNGGRQVVDEVLFQVVYADGEDYVLSTNLSLDVFDEVHVLVTLNIPFNPGGVLKTQIFVGGELWDEKRVEDVWR